MFSVHKQSENMRYAYLSDVNEGTSRSGWSNRTTRPAGTAHLQPAAYVHADNMLTNLCSIWMNSNRIQIVKYEAVFDEFCQ